MIDSSVIASSAANRLNRSAVDRGDGALGAWRREGGQFVIEVGASSRDIRLRSVIGLPDDAALPPLIPDAELLALRASRHTQGYRA